MTVCHCPCTGTPVNQATTQTHTPPCPQNGHGDGSGTGHCHGEDIGTGTYGYVWSRTRRRHRRVPIRTMPGWLTHGSLHSVPRGEQPPAQRMYLLGKDRDKHKTQFTFADFFPMHQMSREHAGLDIITMKEFLEETAMKGQLRNKFTGQVEFPPDNNRTDWDGQDFTVLKEWLRNVTVTPTWSPGRCLAAFPARGGTADVQELVAMQKKIETEGRPMTEFVDEPVPVDASPMERLRENMSGRRQLCVYDEAMQQAPVVHFLCSHKLKVRMLGKCFYRIQCLLPAALSKVSSDNFWQCTFTHSCSLRTGEKTYG